MVARNADIRNLKQQLRRQQQRRPSQICIFDNEKHVLHALYAHFSFLNILKMFSFFLRREMTCLSSAVVWTTCEYDDKCSIL